MFIGRDHRWRYLSMSMPTGAATMKLMGPTALRTYPGAPLEDWHLVRQERRSRQGTRRTTEWRTGFDRLSTHRWRPSSARSRIQPRIQK